MASTGIPHFDELTVNNGGIKDLRELIWLSTILNGAINTAVTVETGVENGKRVAGVGDMPMVGLPSKGCGVDWNATPLSVWEKVWELGCYDVAEQVCYTDIEATIAKWSMRTGTNKADLTGTDYLDIIIEPRLRKAMEEMLWRLIWFGDKEAKSITDGGIITDGSIATTPFEEYFQPTDGLFKRLLAITTDSASQRVTIAANAEATYAAQREEISKAGVARGIFDSIFDNAPSELMQKDDKVVLATVALVKALRNDLRNMGYYSDLAWKAVFDGYPQIDAIEYDGHKIIALPAWDKIITTYENTGTKWNNPYRAVYAGKSSLLAGFESDGELPTLQVWFEMKDQMNYMLAKDCLGTQTIDDANIIYAY